MDLLVKLLLFLAIIIGSAGVAVILLRRKAIWTLSGQILTLKGVVFGAVAVASTGNLGPGQNFLLIALIALAAIFLMSAVGMAVLIRCQRFEGTLDYANEQNLKN